MSRKLIFFYSALLVLSTWAYSDTLPGTNVIGWQQVANTSPSLVSPSSNPGGTFAALVYAWSSGYYDKNRYQFCIMGGGHTDYAGNEIYCIQLDGNPAFVKRMTSPSSFTGVSGTTSDDGSPRSTHTYDTLLFDPVEDSLILNHVSSSWFSSDSDGKIYQVSRPSFPASNSSSMGAPPWVVTETDFMNGTAPGGAGPGAGSGDFDSNTGLVFWTSANLSSALIAYNPSGTQTRQGITAHGLSTISTASIGCYNCTSVVDPTEKRLYQFGDSAGPYPYQYWNIDPGAGGSYGAVTRFSTPPTGCPSFTGSAPGADWDPVTQTVVIWPYSGNPSGSNLYAYNPSASSRSYGSLSVPAGQCVNLTTGLPISGSGPAANNDGGGAQNNGTYKRFRYIDYCNCFVVLNAYSQNLYLVRTRLAVPTVSTPTFSPGAGTYTAAQSVAISTATGGATLCYTTDNSTPTADGAGTCSHGSTYSTAISVSASQTLQAIGSESGFSDSGVGSAAYSVTAHSWGSGGLSWSGTSSWTAAGSLTWASMGSLTWN